MRFFTCLLLLSLAPACTAFRPATVPSVSRRRTSSTTATPACTTGLFGGSPDCSTASPASAAMDEPLIHNHKHSASDWLYNVRSMPHSKVLREIRQPVLAVAAWSAFVSVVHRLLASSGSLRALASHMCIPGTAHGFLVSALGLLLVFRTNSAYQRFYEGRKIWENILSVSRNLSRMVQLYSKEIGSERQQTILNLVAAYPYLLRHHIRPGCLCESSETVIPKEQRLLLLQPSERPVETRHEGDKDANGSYSSTTTSTIKDCWVDKSKLPWRLFDSRSVETVARAQNRPIWVCDRIARLVASIPYGPNFTSRERLTLLSKVDKLTDAVGQCERIHQTAVPLNYARHSLRSLTLWLFTLPFALVKDLGLMTAPVNAGIAWLLFGVYQIGYSIEDPFQGSLRLSILCDAIRRDVIGHHRFADSAFETAEEEPNAGLPEPLLIDKELLQAPRLVDGKNGTFTTFDLVEA